MNRMIRTSLFLVMCAVGTAQMTLQVCDPYTLEPLDLDEMMVGTQVSLVVSSDANSIWSGGLYLRNENRTLGSLSGRVRDPNSRDWLGSHLPAAGPAAKVKQWKDSYIAGFDLYTDELIPHPGPWFVIDYTATALGDCTIEFYDYRYSWTECDPNLTLTLHQTPTRDFNQDQRVNLTDLALFTRHWQHTGCNAPALCIGADMDLDGTVGLTDLLAFSDFWLWGNPGWQPFGPRMDPRITYQVVDGAGNSSVSLAVGETATFYIYKTTLDVPVHLIDMEVMISDPNLGWIDNTAYDPNNPEASGTAAILAEPRYAMFDYWGPGYTQPEGVTFMMLGLFDPLSDGPAASFQYTAVAPGQVTLHLQNHLNECTILLPLEIEQSDPEAMMMSGASTETETTDSVELLNQLYEESEELQQTMDPVEWERFIEEVRLVESSDVSIQ